MATKQIYMDTNTTIILRQILLNKYMKTNKQQEQTQHAEIGLKLPGLSKAPRTFMNRSIYVNTSCL